MRTAVGAALLICVACAPENQPKYLVGYEVLAAESFKSAGAAAAGLNSRINQAAATGCKPIDIAAGSGDPSEAYVAAFVLVECREVVEEPEDN